MASPTGSLFIVTAPSGAGKTSLVRALLEQDAQIQLSVSYTTRAAREGEVQGRDYHFVSTEAFEELLAKGDFLEHARVYGNYYGTSRSWINRQRALGNDILLEIDWQGATQVRRVFPEAIGIFILPPSMEELRRRLAGRGTDSPEVIARRLKLAREEISHVGEFDYVIINKDFDDALRDMACIVRSARLTRHRQLARHSDLLSKL